MILLFICLAIIKFLDKNLIIGLFSIDKIINFKSNYWIVFY